MGLNLRALYDMTDSERASFRKRADAAFAEHLAGRSKTTRVAASKPDRRSRPGDDMICMPMVIHEKNRGGVVASNDGSESKKVFLPFNAGVEIYHPPGNKWAAITMPKWLRNKRKLLKKEFRSELPPPKPGFLVGHPEYEAYQGTEDCERTSIDAMVRFLNEKLVPVRSFARKSYGGSTS